MENTPEAATQGGSAFAPQFRVDPERPIARRDIPRLEAIVLPRYRPVFDIVNDSFADPPPPWKLLSAARKKIEPAIRAVGRVELDGLPGVPYGGTAFVVGPGLMLTNRHVAEFFSSGVGDRDLKFISGRSVAVDFKQENGSTAVRKLKVRRVLLIHPYWDACLLQVTGLPASQPQLTLMAREPDDVKKRDVAVIGYPAPDPHANLALQLQIFRGIFYKKRLQPGKTIGYRPVKSYTNKVESLAHDCSTLGGNSGSVVLDVKTGQAIGLHFAGAYLEANYSVPSWQLARDSRVVDLGVKFSVKPAKGSAAPAWLSAWKNLKSG